jgi:hypothetical protein
MNMMKTLMIILMVLGMAVVSVFADESSDEGPTVIIVGSEQDKGETVHDQQPENIDQYPIEENNHGEESPASIGNEVENPDNQYMEQNNQDTEGSEEE